MVYVYARWSDSFQENNTMCDAGQQVNELQWNY